MSDTSPEGDAFGLVVSPVDTQIDSALTVLLLGLRQILKTARHQRSNHSVIACSNTVELIRHESERNVVGAVEVSKNLKQRASESGVPRRIGWKRWCEVRPG